MQFATNFLVICGKKRHKELVKICEIHGKPFFKFDKKKILMSINVKSLIPVLNAEWTGSDSDVFVDHISIDSRSLQNGSQTLFIALSGINNDAHLYIAELIEKGVQNFVVQHIPENYSGKANFLVVETRGARRHVIKFLQIRLAT